MEGQSDRFVRLKELAEMFGVSERTLWNWRRRGLMPLVELGPRVKGLPEAEALELMRRGLGEKRRRDGECG